MAQLKDLIVNGASRFIGPIYGTASNAVTASNGVHSASAAFANAATCAVNSTHAGSAGYAASATSASQAVHAACANYATTAAYSVTALRALSAGSAGFAASATSASQAIHAASANYTTTSAYAVTALRAVSAASAGYATSAAYSTCGANAIHAGSAGYATSAAYATCAANATKAGSAGYAASAANATYAGYLVNKGGANITIAAGPWAHGKTGAGNAATTSVWSQRWTQSGLTYTASGATAASTLTDSGDMVIWLSKSNTSNALYANMAIDGQVYAMQGFLGDLAGKAGSAGYAASAAQATHAASATYAGSALTASYSVTGLRAISAGSAGYAASALTASYSVTGLRAISSGSAGYATSAAQATHAASASFASAATCATNATNAGGVVQTITDSTNAAYRVLFSQTADNTTRTEATRKSSKLTFNPSSGTLTSTYLKATGEVAVGSWCYATDGAYHEDWGDYFLSADANNNVYMHPEVLGSHNYGSADPTTSTKHPGGSGSLYFQTLDSTDWIVAQGIESYWYWFKWASGKATCEAIIPYTVTGWNAWGNAYEAAPGLSRVNFPSGLFISAPQFYVVANASVGIMGVETYMNVTSTQTPACYATRPNASGTNFAVSLCMQASGRWR